MNKIQFIACSSFKYSLDRHCMNNQLSLSLQPSIYFCSTIFNSIQFNWALSYFSILTASCNSFCVVLPYIYLYIFIVLIIFDSSFFLSLLVTGAIPRIFRKVRNCRLAKILCVRERDQQLLISCCCSFFLYLLLVLTINILPLTRFNISNYKLYIYFL